MILSEIANYVDESIRSTDITLEEYITIDCLLQNKEGRTIATNLPPSPCSLTKYKPGDILIGNIRPYLKKIWKANCEGGCSNDVLVFRAKDSNLSDYLYALLLQDNFYSYVMKAPKGSKMPRGDKNHIMRFPVADIGSNAINVGEFISDIERKMTNNRKQNDLLEKLAKQLYDYWFVQFDFPDENGRPYKSSGGAMVYNEQLKREIPEGWVVDSLYKIATFVNGLACQKFRPKEGEGSLPVIKIREMHDGITPDTENVSCNIPDKYKIYNGDILFSWSSSLEVMMWANGNGGLNQHIFKVTEKEGFSKHFVYFKLLDYVNIFRIMAEARKTTMGHITTDHLSQSKVELPHDLSIINKFEDTVAPIFEKIIQNTIEINSFKKQVSTLLPLLMTGQATLK